MNETAICNGNICDVEKMQFCYLLRFMRMKLGKFMDSPLCSKFLFKLESFFFCRNFKFPSSHVV